MAKKTLAQKMAENSKSVVEALKTNTIGSFSSTENIKKNIIILDELRDLIPPLLETELLALKENLQKHGCKDPLKVWQTTNLTINFAENPDAQVYVLIDGHNRFQLCNELQIPFNIQIDNFESINEVRNFMIDFQLSRRNITPQQASYLRGIRYNTEKKTVTENLFQRKESDVILPNGQNVHLDDSAISTNENTEQKNEIPNTVLPNGQNVHLDDSAISANENTEQKNEVPNAILPNGQNVHLDDSAISANENTEQKNEISNTVLPNGQNVHLDDSAKKTTAQELGQYFNVDEKTIRRDADFARGLDKLSPVIRKEILSGLVKVEKSKIQKIGKAQNLNEPLNSLNEIEMAYQNLATDTNTPATSNASPRGEKLIKERYLKLTDTLSRAYESKSAKEINALKNAFNKFLEALN
ncbi:MAG: hypothetical protein U5M51_12885 [Emticicia sp.]|nr:hypothetical protein [Emticicia sp.]